MCVATPLGLVVCFPLTSCVRQPNVGVSEEEVAIACGQFLLFLQRYYATFDIAEMLVNVFYIVFCVEPKACIVQVVTGVFLTVPEYT